jgi:hypothetical protein
MSQTTATTILGGGTATIGDVRLRSASGGSLSTDGSLKVSGLSSNTISSNNSTTSILAGDATFTGVGDDVSSYSSITIQIDASHDSATDGMTFQFSSDDTNWDDVYTFTYTAADGARRFQFPATAQYFRFVYTNGPTLQTHFRVQTILHIHNILTSIHRLVDDTNPDRSAQVMKSAIIAQAAGTGNFTPVQSTAAGNLKTAIEEFDAALPAGTATIGSVNIGQTTATTILGGSTATIGDVRLRSASGGSLSTDGVLKTDAGTPVLGAGTATVGSIDNIAQTTATYILGAGTATIGVVGLSSNVVIGAGTATIGEVRLRSASGGSLSTDGVLKTDAGTPVLGAGTATVGSIDNIAQTTATYILGAGTATIGVVGLSSSVVIGAGTATVGFVRLSESTATTILGAGTATIGDVRLRSASGGSLSTDGVLKTDAGTPVLAGGTATIGSIDNVAQTTATYVLGGSTATIGRLGPNTATIGVVGLSSAVVLGAGTATVGSIIVSETTATTILGGSTATIGRLGPNTATIGVVGLSSNVVIGAGTATIGELYAADKTDVVAGNAGINYTPKFAVIESTVSGTTPLVTTVTGKRLRVLAGWLIGSAGANVEFRSDTSSDNNLTGLTPLATISGSGWIMPYSKVGHFQTSVGGDLVLYSDTAINIGGALTYIEAS